jgi:hypothetical protein
LRVTIRTQACCLAERHKSLRCQRRAGRPPDTRISCWLAVPDRGRVNSISYQRELAGIYSMVELNLRTFALGQPVQTYRSAALPKCCLHRLSIPEPAIKANRKAHSRIIAN